jgi:hypothetical protein
VFENLISVACLPHEVIFYTECVLRLPLLHTHGLALGRVWVALLGRATDSNSFDSRSYLAVMSLRERTRRRGGIEPCQHSFALLHEKSRLA